MEIKETNIPQVVSDRNLIWFTRLIVFLCGANLILRLISSFFPKERLWGINHLAYFSPYFAFAITILGLLVLVPRINYWVQSILKKSLNFIYEITIKRHKYLYFVIFSFLSIILFWFFRTNTPLLGDGYHLTVGSLAEEAILPWEFLERTIRFYLKQLLAVDLASSYALVSFVAGAIFVFFTSLTADLLGKSKFQKVFVFSILISMGSILLFFGYIEHYSLSYANMLAYIYFSIKYLKNKGSILPVTLTFILGCFLHLLTFSLFPSLIFLYLLRPDTYTGNLHISKKRILLFSLIGVIIVIGVYIYVMISGRYSSLLTITVPLAPAWYSMPYYTLFSGSHLLDMLNEHLLVSPIGLVLLLSILIVFGLSRITFKDRVFQFLIIVMSFQLAFHFLVDPNLGAARDWDLFSFTTLGYTLLGIYLFLRLLRNKQQIRYIGIILVFTSIFSTLPWVALNASTGKSLERVINAIELDPRRYWKVYVEMENYIEREGILEGRLRRKIDELFRVHFPVTWIQRRAEEQMKTGNLDRAKAIYKEAVRIAPGRISTHYNLGAFYLRIGELDSAIVEFEKAIQLDPNDIIAFSSYAGLGYIYLRGKRFGKAIEMYNKAVKGEIDNKESVYQNLGHCYLLTNESDDAILAYQKALKLNPNFTQPHIYLGHAYLKKGMKNKAIEKYRTYLKYAISKEEVEKVKILISEINKNN